MTPDWAALAQRFSPAAVEHVRRLHETPGSFSLTARDLAREAGISDVDAAHFLEQPDLVLRRREYTRCSACNERLDDLAAADECPRCHTAFVDFPYEVEVRYELHRDPPRDVPWVLVLHGMNTMGTWQEELSWLISRSYGRMVPVAIYKYGIIRPGVLFGWRQQMLVRSLSAKIRKLSGDAAGDGFGGRPDVIAHSFGTWLIAHAMLSDPQIRIGRLILLGCIVRPDFDWQQLVANGQVTDILNHGASRDIWVRLSQLAIPNSGPGGIRGFGPPVQNISSVGLSHSDYFTPESRMHGFLIDTWRPFLSWTDPPRLGGDSVSRSWRPLPAPLRLLTRVLVIGLFIAVVASSATALILGALVIARWF